MRHARRRATKTARFATIFGILTACACGGGSGDAPPRTDEATVDAWIALYEAKEFFRLRDVLARLESRPDDAPRLHFLRAAVEHAFNRTEASNATLAALLARDDLPDGTRKDAFFLQLNNFVRLYRYDEAGRSAEALLGMPNGALEADERDRAANMHALMRALSGVPPQELVERGDTVLDYGDDGRIPVRIGDRALRIPFDTGANLSLLMRSEAERLGLTIRPAGIEVGTSTDRRVRADLAVADRVSIGALEYRHVVFLVFPDELLTFSDGHVIEGLVGFPLIEAMGEIRFRGEGLLEIPERVPEREIGNLALAQLDPLVRVGYGDDDLICRLDSGADDTTFYEPFHRSYPGLFEGLGEPQEVSAAGVGGVTTLPAHVLPRLEFELGGNAVTLDDVEVYTVPIVDDARNDLDCNIGRTALSQFDGYVLNFRSMAFVTEKVP